MALITWGFCSNKVPVTPCPAGSEGFGSGLPCACLPGWAGAMTWVPAGMQYNGTCHEIVSCAAPEVRRGGGGGGGGGGDGGGGGGGRGVVFVVVRLALLPASGVIAPVQPACSRCRLALNRTTRRCTRRGTAPTRSARATAAVSAQRLRGFLPASSRGGARNRDSRPLQTEPLKSPNGNTARPSFVARSLDHLRCEVETALAMLSRVC